MKSRYLIPGLATLLLILCGAGALNAQSRARLVNVIKEAPALDLHVDSAAGASVSGVTSGSASELAPVAAGAHTFTVTTVGAPVTNGVAGSPVQIAADSIYSYLLAVGEALDPVLISSPASISVPADSVLVRFLNLSSAGTLGVGGSVSGGFAYSVEGLMYKDLSPYHMVPASDFTVTIKDATGKPIHKTLGYLAGGMAVTILISGEYVAEDLARLGVFVLNDSASAAQPQLQAFSLLPLTQGAFRVVHAVANAGSIAVFRDNVAADSIALAYHFASPRRTDLLEAHTFALARREDGLANPFMSVPVSIAADSVTTLIAAGRQGGTTRPIIITSAIASPPLQGRTMLRVVDAVDGATFDAEITYSDQTKQQWAGLQLGSVSPFSEVPSGAVEMVIPRSAPQEPLRFGGVLPVDAVVTAIISGGEGSDDAAREPAYVNLLVEDNPLEQEPMILLSPLSSVPGFRGARAIAASISPNPAGATARIVFALAATADVRIIASDMMGRETILVASSRREAGPQSVAFPTAGLAAGAYTVTARTGDGVALATGRMIIAR